MLRRQLKLWWTTGVGKAWPFNSGIDTLLQEVFHCFLRTAWSKRRRFNKQGGNPPTSEPAGHCHWCMPSEGELGTTVQFPAHFPATGNEYLQADPRQGSGDGVSQGRSSVPGLGCRAGMG